AAARSSGLLRALRDALVGAFVRGCWGRVRDHHDGDVVAAPRVQGAAYQHPRDGQRVGRRVVARTGHGNGRRALRSLPRLRPGVGGGTVNRGGVLPGRRAVAGVRGAAAGRGVAGGRRVIGGFGVIGGGAGGRGRSGDGNVGDGGVGRGVIGAGGQQFHEVAGRGEVVPQAVAADEQRAGARRAERRHVRAHLLGVRAEP